MSRLSNGTTMLNNLNLLSNFTVDSLNTLNMVKIKLDILLTNPEFRENEDSKIAVKKIKIMDLFN